MTFEQGFARMRCPDCHHEYLCAITSLHLNEKISNLSKQLNNVTTAKLQGSVLKGICWKLLIARENFQTKEKSVEHLRQALETKQLLATVYYMKGDLRLVFWRWLGDKQAAEWHLEELVKRRPKTPV